MSHWTSTVYRVNGRLFFDVEGALFQNDLLSDYEIARLHDAAAELQAAIDAPLLDLACGPGRHTLRLARDLASVTGIDHSEAFLEIARSAVRQGAARNNRPHFACGDMRQLPCPTASFRTVVLLGNSFGYFSEEQNSSVLDEVHRVLCSGGFFCLELTDKGAYLPRFKAFESERIRGSSYGELESKWWKWWEPSSQRLHTWESHRSKATGEVLYEGAYDLRLYDQAELEELLLRVGFSAVSCRPGRPGDLRIGAGLGETLGAAGEVLFVGALK